MALALLFAALPFLDRSRGDGLRSRGLSLVLGLVFFLGIVALGV